MKIFLLMVVLFAHGGEEEEFIFKVPMADAEACMEEMEKLNDLTFKFGQINVNVTSSCLIENEGRSTKV